MEKYQILKDNWQKKGEINTLRTKHDWGKVKNTWLRGHV